VKGKTFVSFLILALFGFALISGGAGYGGSDGDDIISDSSGGDGDSGGDDGLWRIVGGTSSIGGGTKNYVIPDSEMSFV
jgi:hypothetical protein